MFDVHKDILNVNRSRCLIRGLLPIVFGTFLANGALAQSYNEDGTRADGAAPAAKDSAIAAIVNDRAGVIDAIANRGFLPFSGPLSDSQELSRQLSGMSDSRLAAASRATSTDQLLTIIKGGSVPAVDGLSSGLAPLLGAPASELVYTPITPCRIFDTRTDIRGLLGPFATREFAVQGTVISNQGGDVADCPDIPFDPPAVAITITSAIPATPGFATVWEALAPQPVAGTLGFNVSDLISNTTITPVCVSCGTQVDIQLNVFGVAQFVGDVVGYFAPPSDCGPGRIEVVGVCMETVLRNPPVSVFSASADCEDEGGRLPSMGELFAALDTVTGDAGGEHSDSFYFGTTFQNMRITSGSGLVNPVSTVTPDPYRCVFDLFDH